MISWKKKRFFFSFYIFDIVISMLFDEPRFPSLGKNQTNKQTHPKPNKKPAKHQHYKNLWLPYEGNSIYDEF